MVLKKINYLLTHLHCILKLYIVNENIDEITCQLEVQFSGMNIFNVGSTTNIE